MERFTVHLLHISNLFDIFFSKKFIHYLYRTDRKINRTRNIHTISYIYEIVTTLNDIFTSYLNIAVIQSYTYNTYDFT